MSQHVRDEIPATGDRPDGASDFAVFATAIGPCGIIWNNRGTAGVALPLRSEGATRARIGRSYRAAREAVPPPEVARAITDIVALLAGAPRDLRQIRLDAEALPEFNRRVYDVTRGIAPGATLSYGEIAERLGDRNLAREVAAALGENPFPLIVPCHRVLAAGGKIGGFSGPGGVRTKLRLLTIEGARTEGPPTLFDRLPWVTPPQRRA